jgi:hypothetical protein
MSLDDPLYDTPAPGFPATWKNPFDRTQADCGAILVGAGAPPPGTHGNNRGPDRSRLSFSNYGASLDAQGWGAELTTLGYGDLQMGSSEDVWYTKNFGGTSGAAALVAGVLASLQGMQLSGGKRPPLTPAQVRAMLRQSVNTQQDGPTAPATQSIGPRPDLVALKALLSTTKNESKDSKDGKDNKENKENKDTKDNKEAPDKADKDQKDNKETKEEKEEKDVKDAKENTKDGSDKLAPKENDQPQFVPPGQFSTPATATPDEPSSAAPAPAAPAVPDEPVQHFIPEALRPDLTASYLGQEPEFRGRDAGEVADELRPADGVVAGA